MKRRPRVGDRVGQRTIYGALRPEVRFRYGTVFSVTAFRERRGDGTLIMIRWDGEKTVQPCRSEHSLLPEAEMKILEARVRLGEWNDGR